MTYNDSPEGLLKLLKTTKSEQAKGQFKVKPHWWAKSSYCCLGIAAKALGILRSKWQATFGAVPKDSSCTILDNGHSALPSDHWLKEKLVVRRTTNSDGMSKLEDILANINDNSYDEGYRHFEMVIAFLENYIKHGPEQMVISRTEGAFYGRITWTVNES